MKKLNLLWKSLLAIPEKHSADAHVYTDVCFMYIYPCLVIFYGSVKCRDLIYCRNTNVHEDDILDLSKDLEWAQYSNWAFAVTQMHITFTLKAIARKHYAKSPKFTTIVPKLRAQPVYHLKFNSFFPSVVSKWSIVCIYSFALFEMI